METKQFINKYTGILPLRMTRAQCLSLVPPDGQLACEVGTETREKDRLWIYEGGRWLRVVTRN